MVNAQALVHQFSIKTRVPGLTANLTESMQRRHQGHLLLETLVHDYINHISTQDHELFSTRIDNGNSTKYNIGLIE